MFVSYFQFVSMVSVTSAFFPQSWHICSTTDLHEQTVMDSVYSSLSWIAFELASAVRLGCQLG